MRAVPDSKSYIQQFAPERVTPIRNYITKKYFCQENCVGKVTSQNLTTLTWRIKEEDPSIIWKSAKVCLPVKVNVKSNNPGTKTRISNGCPASNVAFSAHPQQMFSDCQLIANGKVFTTEPCRFDPILSRCYRGRDVDSYQSNNSLKPIVNRNLKNSFFYQYPLIIHVAVLKLCKLFQKH